MNPSTGTTRRKTVNLPGKVPEMIGIGIGVVITATVAVVVSIATQPPEQTTVQGLTIAAGPVSPSYAVAPGAEFVTDEGADHTGRPYLQSFVKLRADRLDYSSPFAPRFTIIVSDPTNGESVRCKVTKSYRWSHDWMNYTALCDTVVPHDRVSSFTAATVEDTTPRGP
ncbi:hypothetical protein [Plantibacter sp. CFBP 8775]|uniref:hypothetical protein n=1 Tax=Plantibacter sp. CFBP 8775 TaxID=2774038 RepID=UPI001780E189|nr:hypothetical protein [Plantibacter sp. CFBP 8775]MBD8104785.1 hypothetical protein [Plantibacter sp. CFBP 8775]